MPHVGTRLLGNHMTINYHHITRAHRLHYADLARVACTCGWVSDDKVVMTDPQLHAEHLAEQLSAAAELDNDQHNAALKWAADVVHSEARWQTECDMRGYPGAQLIAQRMTVIENVLRGGIRP